MDQSQLNALDPKLRDTYQRIMNTQVQAKPAPPGQIPETPAPPPSNSPAASSQMISEPAIKPLENTMSQPEVPTPQNIPETPSPAAPPTPTPPHIMDNIQQVAPLPPPAPQIFTSQPLSTAAENQIHAYIAQEVTGARYSLQMIQVIYIVGGIVFFVVYALFWMKFFNVASPF